MHVMDAWTIYWVTRLDMIVNLWIVVVTIATVGTVFWLVLAAMWANTEKMFNDPKFKRLYVHWAVIGASISLLGVMLVILTPTTRQAAAMLVIPAVANDENVQKEAGELYGLAKEWLREQVQMKESSIPGRSAGEGSGE